MLGARRTREQHRAVQLVFQDPYSSLNPRLSVRSVLSELLVFHGLAQGEALERRCQELMALVGLPADALDGYPSSFSGGQRQRIAIARALAVEPQVVVADEPISSLDVSVQAAILALFADLRDRLGIGMVLISHNLAVVRNICDRAAVMYLGRIVEVGEREDDICRSPPPLHAGAAGGGAPPAAGARPCGGSAEGRTPEPDGAAQWLRVPPPLPPSRADLRDRAARAPSRPGWEQPPGRLPFSG